MPSSSSCPLLWQEKELDPHSIFSPTTWRLWEKAFNWIFLFELLINMSVCTQRMQ